MSRLEYVITRTDNGWTGEVVLGIEVVKRVTTHEDGQFSQPQNEALAYVLTELFLTYAQTKHLGGIEIGYHDCGSDDDYPPEINQH